MANEGRIIAVWAMPASNISDRRHDFPRQPYALDHMVSSNVVCHDPEDTVGVFDLRPFYTAC